MHPLRPSGFFQTRITHWQTWFSNSFPILRLMFPTSGSLKFATFSSLHQGVAVSVPNKFRLFFLYCLSCRWRNKHLISTRLSFWRKNSHFHFMTHPILSWQQDCICHWQRWTSVLRPRLKPVMRFFFNRTCFDDTISNRPLS
jgi:hypothetical protein